MRRPGGPNSLPRSARKSISTLIKEIEAETIKDMGRAMAALKQRFAGRMDFSKASAQVKKLLGGG
jgi:uncharacterized protein YqeY